MSGEVHHQERGRRRKERSPLQKTTKWLENAGGLCICLLICATPWLYGTTEEWSVRLMNIGSYITGAVFLIAALVNRFDQNEEARPRQLSERIATAIFLCLNISVLLYCALAYWNARATFSITELFTYRDDYNPSLPTTYDADLTLETTLSLLACFVIFWSARYWLLNGFKKRADGEGISWFRNKRFLLLAWVISLNGMAIAIQGTLQRLSGSAKLLWIRDSWWNYSLACFGPYSYRGNASEYLNLIWPLAFGFWWILSRERQRRQGTSRLFTDGPELLLIPATLMILVASIFTLSRGGAVIAAGCAGVLGAVFLAQSGMTFRARMGFISAVLVVIVTVAILGWRPITNRFKAYGLTNLGGREEIYRNAKQMTADYPVFGTGPGTFRSVYHLYRQDTEERWHGFLHDDWLETRATFGWVGFALVVANLLVLAWWICASGRPEVPYIFVASTCIGLLGTLAHAKFDFPFQTYSILFTFVVIAAIVTTVSPSRK